MDTANSVIITYVKQFEIQSSFDRNIIILTTSQSLLNTFKRNIKHVFRWKSLCPACSQAHLRKNLEIIFITLYKPSVNDKKYFDRLMSYENCIA